ncbi:hypothetical protein UYSO10_3259 [Kosakonia radicincitans]|nr:hypothetical protein UYSO10_3259 [Kosakonia radicincitans]
MINICFRHSHYKVNQPGIDSGELYIFDRQLANMKVPKLLKDVIK